MNNRIKEFTDDLFDEIYDEIHGRSGIGWDMIDDDIKEELNYKLKSIIGRHIANALEGF